MSKKENKYDRLMTATSGYFFGVIKLNKIPFNDWSKKAIKKGHKFMTSRHKKYLHDSRVKSILPKTSWGFIRDNYWFIEGAESPEELQEVIESIYKREVCDDEMFYPHIGDFSDQDEQK